MTREGGRPLLIELQALVDRMRFGAPRRIAQGLDANRVAMLLAVLNRHARCIAAGARCVRERRGRHPDQRDRLGPAGGARARLEPEATRRSPTRSWRSARSGLTGEVRPVAYGEERLREAQKQGFKMALVPQGQCAAQAARGPAR